MINNIYSKVIKNYSIEYTPKFYVFKSTKYFFAERTGEMSNFIFLIQSSYIDFRSNGLY